MRTVHQAQLATGFQPGKTGLRLGRAVHRHRGAQIGRLQRNVVAELVGKGLHAGTVRATFPGRAHIQVGGTLLVQIHIAHFKGVGGHVHAVSKQLRVFGRTLTPCKVACKLPLGCNFPQTTQGQAGRIEAATAGREAGNAWVAQRLHLHRRQPRPSTELAPVGCKLFVREDRHLVSAAVGRVSLYPVCREIALLPLQTDHPIQRTLLGLTGLDAQILARVLEQCARHPGVELGVAVVAAAELGFKPLQPALQLAHLTFQRIAAGLHVDLHLVLGHRAVPGGKGGNRSPDVTIIKEHRAAQRTAPRFTGGVANAPRHGRDATLRASQGFGHAHIIGAACLRVCVQGIARVARLQQQRTTALCIAASQTQIDLARDATRSVEQGLAGNAVVDHIDHATDSTAAILQGCRPAQDLDALHRQRVQRDRMVGAQARGIHRGTPVVQDADAVAIQASNHRATGIGAEVGAADARRAIQRLAQRGLGAQQQSLAAVLRCGNNQVLGSERVAGDGDRGQGLLRWRGACLGTGLGPSPRT